MEFFKEVFVFTEGDKGFTEVWFSQAANISVASQFGAAFIDRCIAFRNSLTVLRKIRISSVENNRSTAIVNINRSMASSSNRAAISGAAAVYTINAPSISSRRQVWFRGLDAAQVIRNETSGADILLPGLDNNIKAYISALAGSNYMVRALGKINPVTGYNKITTVQATAGAGLATLTMQNDHGFAQNARIIVSQTNTKDFPGLNGHYTALAVPTTKSILIAYNLHVTGTFTATTGRIRAETYSYGAIDTRTSNFNFFGTRDTGRSPLGGRGRRTARRLRSA